MMAEADQTSYPNHTGEPMTENDRQTEFSKEELILKSMKLTLIDVIKDTTVPPGMKHPLSEKTIEEIRDCLVLISHREKELAELAGRPSKARPYFVDEPRREVAVPLSQVVRTRTAEKDGE